MVFFYEKIGEWLNIMSELRFYNNRHIYFKNMIFKNIKLKEILCLFVSKNIHVVGYINIMMVNTDILSVVYVSGDIKNSKIHLSYIHAYVIIIYFCNLDKTSIM